VFVPGALAQVGNTDRAHLQCAQGGGNGPVFGARSGSDVGGMAALTDPNADHGAAGVLANNGNAGGPGEGGSSGGLGGSSLRGGGAGGCPGPTLPLTGAPIGRLALWGASLFVLGVPLLLIAREHAWSAAAVGRRIASYSLDTRIGRRLRYLEIRELNQSRRRF
jgi:hypothetical protein